LLGEMVVAPGVPQSVQNLLGKGEEEHLLRVKVPEELKGKSFGEAITHFRKEGLLALALVKEQKSLSLSHVLSEDYSYLDQFIERKFQEAGRSLRKGEHLDIQINPPDTAVIDPESYLILIK
jgi:hypothetical protein